MTKKVSSKRPERKRTPVAVSQKSSAVTEVNVPPSTRHTSSKVWPASHIRYPPRQRRQRWSFGIKTALIVVGAIGVLGLLFVLSNPGAGGKGQAGQYAFAVGNPGPGELAPPIKLPTTTGGTFDLAALRGKTVLLFFQEGIGCQPCWDQLKDIEAQWSDFRALGIDQIVSITGNPLDVLKQKVADEGLSTPILADPDLAVSQTYGANQYGMMGTSADGHSFIVVGPYGRIRWRADYGGPPNYTMYVPIPTLLADLRKGLTGATA